jgi:hypothetical protein
MGVKINVFRPAVDRRRGRSNSRDLCFWLGGQVRTSLTSTFAEQLVQPLREPVLLELKRNGQKRSRGQREPVGGVVQFVKRKRHRLVLIPERARAAIYSNFWRAMSNSVADVPINWCPAEDDADAGEDDDGEDDVEGDCGEDDEGDGNDDEDEKG